mgnify:CR=1 FL=1
MNLDTCNNINIGLLVDIIASITTIIAVFLTDLFSNISGLRQKE